MKIHFISTTLTPRGLELVYQYKAKDWIEKNLLTALPHRSPMRQVIPEKIYKEFMDKNNLRRSVYYLMEKEALLNELLSFYLEKAFAEPVLNEVGRSNCCDAPVRVVDLCSKCGEHCEIEY